MVPSDFSSVKQSQASLSYMINPDFNLVQGYRSALDGSLVKQKIQPEHRNAIREMLPKEVILEEAAICMTILS